MLILQWRNSSKKSQIWQKSRPWWLYCLIFQEILIPHFTALISRRVTPTTPDSFQAYIVMNSTGWRKEKLLDSDINTVSVDGEIPPLALMCSASGELSPPTEYNDHYWQLYCNQPAHSCSVKPSVKFFLGHLIHKDRAGSVQLRQCPPGNTAPSILPESGQLSLYCFHLTGSKRWYPFQEKYKLSVICKWAL